jgi:tetratricopeptide (TPR) repeat protein
LLRQLLEKPGDMSMTTSPHEILQIFVSHSHKDNDFGIRLVQDLKALLGDDAVWYDITGGLRGGDAWWRKITKELTARPVFLVVLSPDAVESPWVNDEIDMAWHQKNSKSGKRIIPLLHRSCDVRNDLKSLHVISFLSPKTYEAAFEELLKALGLATLEKTGIPTNQSSQKDHHLSTNQPIVPGEQYKTNLIQGVQGTGIQAITNAAEDASYSTEYLLSNTVYHQTGLDTINKYWQEAIGLTKALQPDEQFSTPELVEYLNSLLSSDYEEMTKTKVNYLREEGILRPRESGGSIRKSWRYTSNDVRRVILVELLKTHEGLSIKEIKVWLLNLFEEDRRGEVLDRQAPRTNTPEFRTSPPPTSVNLAYALLRNRALGTLFTVLGFGEVETIPPDCLIGIRRVAHGAENWKSDILTWIQARTLLENNSWFLAASDSSFKLYVYADLQKLQNKQPEVTKSLPQNEWFFLTLQDDEDQLYEVILSLPDVQHSSITAISRSLTRHIKDNLPIKLSNFPGLSTLLSASFVNQPKLYEGTTLSVLAEIIATASDSWDYCYILVPEISNEGEKKWLRIFEYSSKFPSQLKGKRVEIGQPLSGWCYQYRQGVVVERAVENDPRVTFYEEEGHPIAAAAMPAIAEDQRIMGVIYVAKHGQAGGNHSVFTKESLASLKAFSYICGDMIARDQIEIETVRSLNRLSTRPSLTHFSSLETLVRKVADIVQKGVSPEKVAVSWIYLLTLNIQTTSKDTISQWLCGQGADLTGNFLANHLWDSSHRVPLPIGQCEIGNGQHVFAILQAVDIPDMLYKLAVTRLQHEINQMRIRRLSPDFYLLAISFRYEDLRQRLNDKGRDNLVADLTERTWERLIAGPYFKRGHEALLKSDLDNAVSEFEDALRYVPNSWYCYKHLAEARMLQGTEGAIEEAIENCKIAIKLNPYYASAHCLLADCYSYQGRFGEALVEYERTLRIDNTRYDFLTRYGLTLAAMSLSEYRDALNSLQRQEPGLAEQHTYLAQPWQEAIDKFDRVRSLSTFNDTVEEQRERRANYHYYRGYAYLQADLIDKAVEEFAVGRKLAPDNLQLIQAYSFALSLRRKR